MKTIHTALLAVAAALLAAGCSAFAPSENAPSAEPPAKAPAAAPAAKPAKAPAAQSAAKPAAPAVPAAPAAGIPDEQAVRFSGPERNPVVLLCGCSGAEADDAACAGAAARLTAAGYVDESRPLPEGRAYANLFRFSCDPKLDIPGNAAKLHEFLSDRRARLQKKYEECWKRPGYDVQFDVVACGTCGLLARYYLRYGEQPLPANGISLPLLDWRGAKLVDKLILIGTPGDGSLAVLSEIVGNARPDPDAPAGVPACDSPAAYQMLPGVNGGTVHYADAPDGPALDLFDPAVWTACRWGLADPAVRAASGGDTAAKLDNYLRRAKQFRAAMEIPGQPPKDVAIFLFAGNSVPTASRLLVDRGTGRLAVAGYAPGDGRTTVASARFDRRGENTGLPFSQSPISWQAVSHLPGSLAELLASDRLWDDVRYYLLIFPTDRQREVFHLNRK